MWRDYRTTQDVFLDSSPPFVSEIKSGLDRLSGEL